jgi:hypothetical protein
MEYSFFTNRAVINGIAIMITTIISIHFTVFICFLLWFMIRGNIMIVFGELKEKNSKLLA